MIKFDRRNIINRIKFAKSNRNGIKFAKSNDMIV